VHIALRFAGNRPLDVDNLARLVSNETDVHLVWPVAVWPFDCDQWRAALAESDGHRSYYIYDKALLIGHAALRRTGTSRVYNVSFMYLAPAYRGRGLGGQVLQFLDHVAANEIGANALNLVVRDYNPGALKCYLKAGFTECGKDGTAIRMTKVLNRNA